MKVRIDAAQLEMTEHAAKTPAIAEFLKAKGLL
jgi:hypothetical protein